MAVSPFFNSFPKIQYDIKQAQAPNYETVTNIFRRVGYLREVLNNVSSYQVYEIQDGDTPEILAEKVYGDAGANWMIIYANNIVDPQWDWPLAEETFKNYIITKYGSLSAAVSSIHHYEKVVETTVDDITTVRIYWVNEKRLTNNIIDAPYEYYSPYYFEGGQTVDSDLFTADSYTVTADIDPSATGDTSLPHEDSYESYDVNGKTVKINTYGRAVTNYDYELQKNEERRTIKVIKAAYYKQIMNEFNTLTESFPKYIRTFV